jgi:hypothetical protein
MLEPQGELLGQFTTQVPEGWLSPEHSTESDRTMPVGHWLG